MNFTEAIVLAVEKVKAWIQSGGVKWDHVSEKPFGKMPLYAFSGDYEFEYAEGEPGSFALFENIENAEEIFVAVSNNEPVTIVFDGVKYTSVPQIIEGVAYLGNLAVFGGEDTGEPFCAICPGEVVQMACLTDTEKATHNVSLSVEGFKRMSYSDLPKDVKQNEQIVLHIEITNSGQTAYLHKTLIGAINGDESDRLTRSELEAYFDAGVNVIVRSANTYYPVIAFCFEPNEEHGIIYYIALSGGVVRCYTAEYTA